MSKGGMTEFFVFDTNIFNFNLFSHGSKWTIFSGFPFLMACLNDTAL